MKKNMKKTKAQWRLNKEDHRLSTNKTRKEQPDSKMKTPQREMMIKNEHITKINTNLT